MTGSKVFASRWPSWRRVAAIGTVCGSLNSFLGGHVAQLRAQETNITSSGLNTAIPPTDGTTTFIDGGMRPGVDQNRPNLFHSFGDFSIGEGHTALFRNTDGYGGATNNIFGRVTGGNVSNVFGTIDSATNFPQANLWLMNPAGFLFGPTASLNVGGSVNISTADYLKMTDGNQFFADTSNNSVLSMEPVAAFGFTAPRPITIQGSGLAVSAGKSLSFVGGDLDITGRFNETTQTPEGFLFASGGQIQLASVASPGEVAIGTGNTGVPDLDVDSFSQLGNITLSRLAILNASGDSGGTVQIRAGGLTVDGSLIGANTLGNSNGAATAVDIHVAGGILFQNGSAINSETVGAGRSGEILLKSGTLAVTSAAKILSSTKGNGDAGNVSITASAITLADSLSQIGSFTSITGTGAGHAGTVLIDATSIDVTNGAAINNSTFGRGNAGTLTITATERVKVTGSDSRTNFVSSISSGVFVLGTGGDAGSIIIKAPLIEVADAGTITTSNSPLAGRAGDIVLDGQHVTIDTGGKVTSSTSSNAPGGTVTIKATDSVKIAGSSSFVAANTSGDGDAGQVIIRTPTLKMEGGNITGFSGNVDPSTKEIFPNSGRAGSIDIAVRNANITGRSTVRTDTFTNGEGGGMTIKATESFRLSGSTIGSSTLGSGKAGQISLTAPSMTLADDAFVSTNSSGAGQAGTVTLQAARLNLTGGSGVDSSAFGTGSGGAVTITATEQVLLTGSNKNGAPSQITAVTAGSNTGGQIHVTAPVLHLQKGAIFANTGASGNAGSITVTANQLSLTNGARISSSGVQSATGDAGSVNLNVRGLFSSQASTVSSEARQGAGSNVSITAGNVQLTDGTTILAKSTGSKNAGNITLTSAGDIVMRNTTITTSADQASGGGIKLTAPNTIFIADSTLTSSVKGQQGSNGGNISIDPVAVAIQNSHISATANAGAGGNINIVASGAVLVSPTSLLDASAGPAGVSGTVNINAPLQVLSGTLVPLKVAYGQPVLSGDRCAADPQGQFSSFVQTARDGVPQIPGGFAPSPLLPLNRLVSISRGAQGPRLAAARLGLINMGLEKSTPFRFRSTCGS